MRYCGTHGLYAGPRCSGCPRVTGSQAPELRTRAWRTLSKRVIREHVLVHGWTCPGLDPSETPPGRPHPAHPSHDLTTDHRLPRSRGGPVFDRRNLRVLCRSANTLAMRYYLARTPGMKPRQTAPGRPAVVPRPSVARPSATVRESPA